MLFPVLLKEIVFLPDEEVSEVRHASNDNTAYLDHKLIEKAVKRMQNEQRELTKRKGVLRQRIHRLKKILSLGQKEI